MVMMVEAAELRGGGGGGKEGIGQGHGKANLNSLPEGCIAHVLSFTTPRDAGRLSLLSSTFRSAARSDVVWHSFLPSDYSTIISQSSSFASKKDIYLYLSHKPLLIDGGKKSFVLDKLSGKKCYMLSARILCIVWGDTHRYWRWTSLPESRFAEVAELVSVCWLEIRGYINTSTLSPETFYGAYLVFKPSAGGSYGFERQPVEVSVGIVGAGDARRRTVFLDSSAMRRLRRQRVCHRTRILTPRRRSSFRFPVADVEAETQSQSQSLTDALPEPPIGVTEENVDVPPPGYPKERGDGWLEMELGEFFNEGGEDKEVEMAVYEIKSGDWKGGLVVQGIEIRPKPTNTY